MKIPLSRRGVAVAVVGVSIAAAVSLYFAPDRTSSFDTSASPNLAEMADRVGADVMQLVVDGNYPSRTGEILLVPTPNSFIGPATDFATIDTPRSSLYTAHPNPWDYLTQVPIVVSGPRYLGVEPGATISDPVDLTDLAPTYARLLSADFPADGRPLPGIDYGRQRPKLIFTVVIDGGGWNVLRQTPSSWPNLRGMMRNGVTYDNALIGSFPAHTAAIHANIGTGYYPRSHGVTHNFYGENADMQYLEKPTIGDVWDQRTGNRAVVGTLSVMSIHLPMLGHGAQQPGGDRDIGVIWDVEGERWTANEAFYELPSYLAEPDYPRLSRYEADLDLSDGFRDGRWFDNDISGLKEGARRYSTPAFERYEGDDVLEAIRNEGLGTDDVTDLFYVQIKSPDEGGHFWNMVNPEMDDIMSQADAQLERIKDALDRQVGADDYVMVVTADHGQQPQAQSVGGWIIDGKELEGDVQRAFDVKVSVRSHQLNVTSRVSPETIEEIARFLGTYTIGDNIPEGARSAGRVSEARRAEGLFAGAFPTAWLWDLTLEDIGDFGASKYPEGDLRPGGP